jgi:hypothetical protein
MTDLAQLADMCFRDALRVFTGVAPPGHFKLMASDSEHDAQQEWAVDHVRPTWACGISLLEVARAFVKDARENGTILKPDADYPEAFEIAI